MLHSELKSNRIVKTGGERWREEGRDGCERDGGLGGREALRRVPFHVNW